MTAPHIVIDFEFRFREFAEPVCFTVDEARGDVITEDVKTGERVFRLCVSAEVVEFHRFQPRDVCYVRVTERSEEEPPPIYLEGGITITGKTPTLD